MRDALRCNVATSSKRIQRTQIPTGNQECWNEFLNRCKTGQYPQDNYQLHYTRQNSSAIDKSICIALGFLQFIQLLNSSKIMKGTSQRRVHKSGHPVIFYIHSKSFTNFLDTRKNYCNQIALRSAGCITLEALVRRQPGGWPKKTFRTVI